MKFTFNRVKTLIVVSALSVTFIGGWFAESLIGDDYYYEVKRSLRLFGDVYKNVGEKYVDEISPKVIMRTGIDAMLETLDPYTMFYEGSESSDLDAFMKGKYGGIGVTVGIRRNTIMVITVTEGSPAYKAGLKPGDRIVGVDGKTTRDIPIRDLSNSVKGEPGTSLKLDVKREGQSSALQMTMIREMIAIENIPYYGVLAGDIGIIKLTKFSKTSTSDFTRALKDLRSQGIKGLIIDLRGNPGGLLDAAIDITNQFVRKGELITYTKGRIQDANRSYYANNDPLIPQLPVAVLVDGNSASASEIVSGAMQDLDRGILVGSTTFGKGLVQTVYPLQERDAVLKITTAKYYTPSGRCIQREHYAHDRSNAMRLESEDEPNEFYYDVFGEEDQVRDSLTNDSLPSKRQEFKTKTGRIVYAEGGITPDIIKDDYSFLGYTREIVRRGYVFDFATRFSAQNTRIDTGFVPDEELLTEFYKFLKDHHFNYNSTADSQLTALRAYAENNGYSAQIQQSILQLQNKFDEEEVKEFEAAKTAIRNLLQQEIISRYYGNRRRFEITLKSDPVVESARSVLKDEVLYKKILKLK